MMYGVGETRIPTEGGWKKKEINEITDTVQSLRSI